MVASPGRTDDDGMELMAEPVQGVAPIGTGPVRRRLAFVRSRMFSRRLDAELAAGADPWGSSARLLRAQQLMSRAHRTRIGEGLEALVIGAEAQRDAPHLTGIVRESVVLGQRYRLLLLADRVRDVEPIDVRVVAELALLLRDRSSPVYAGGRRPSELAELLARCAGRL